MFKSTVLGAVIAGAVATSASAGDLRFEFLNPSFGGNPNYGAYLFGLADAQRTATIPNTGGGGDGGGSPAVPGVGGGGGVTGPTIIIPIDTGTPTPGEVGVGQVNTDEEG